MTNLCCDRGGKKVCRVYLHAFKDEGGNFFLKNKPKSYGHSCVFMNQRINRSKLRARKTMEDQQTSGGTGLQKQVVSRLQLGSGTSGQNAPVA